MLYLTRDQLDPDRISGLGKNNSAHQVYPSYSTFFYEIAGTFNAGTISLLAPAKSPSVFEIPSSSAPPIFNRPHEPLILFNSGLVRLQNGYQDMGTERERAYMRGISSVY